MTLGEDGCTSNGRRLYQAIIPVFDQYFKILFITNYKYQFVVHKVLKYLNRPLSEQQQSQVFFIVC